MKKYRVEIKIMGIEFLFIFFFCVLVQLIFLSNMNIALETEIIFPLLIMIMTGECVKIRSDDQYELIKIYETSFFFWIFRRYAYVLGTQVISYLVLLSLRGSEFKFIFSFIITTIFFSSLAMLVATYFKNSYSAIAVSGSFGLLAILVKSLSEYKYSKYFYPFNLWADNDDRVLWISKLIMIFISALIWAKIRKISEE